MDNNGENNLLCYMHLWCRFLFILFYISYWEVSVYSVITRLELGHEHNVNTQRPLLCTGPLCPPPHRRRRRRPSPPQCQYSAAHYSAVVSTVSRRLLFIRRTKLMNIFHQPVDRFSTLTPLSTRNHHSKSVEFGLNFKFSQLCQIWGDRTMILKWP